MAILNFLSFILVEDITTMRSDLAEVFVQLIRTRGNKLLVHDKYLLYSLVGSILSALIEVLLGPKRSCKNCSVVKLQELISGGSATLSEVF